MNNKKFDCGICFESLDPKQISSCTQLDCNHLFHDKCLRKWCEVCDKKKNKPNCPLCREKILPDTLDLLNLPQKSVKKRNEIITNSVDLLKYILENKLYQNRENLSRFLERYPEEMNNILLSLETIHLVRSFAILRS